MLVNHEIKCNRKSLIIWSLTVGGMLLLFMLMFPSMKDSMGDISNSFKQMGSFTAAFGIDKLNFATALGFYGIEAGAVISLGGAMFAAIVGISMLAKEEGGHTTEFLYVTPNTRTRVMVHKFLAMIAIVVIFDICCYLFAVAGFVAVDSVPWKDLTLFHVSQVLMHLEVACICFGVSAFLRKSNIGLGIGVATLLYFVNMFANITESVAWLHNVSPFYYCDGAKVLVEHSIDGKYVGIGFLIAAVCVIIGCMYYRKKDLNI